MSDIDVTRPEDYQFRGFNDDILFLYRSTAEIHVVYINESHEVMHNTRNLDGSFGSAPGPRDIIPKPVRKYQGLPIFVGEPGNFTYDIAPNSTDKPKIHPYLTWIEGHRDETLELVKGPELTVENCTFVKSKGVGHEV